MQILISCDDGIHKALSKELVANLVYAVAYFSSRCEPFSCFQINAMCFFAKCEQNGFTALIYSQGGLAAVVTTSDSDCMVCMRLLLDAGACMNDRDNVCMNG